MSVPWSQPGEPGREHDFYFNDVHVLEQWDRAFAIGVYHDDCYVHAVVTYYTNGKAIRHTTEVESWKQELTFTWDADQLDPVSEVALEGHKDTSRTVIDRIAFTTANRKFDFAGVNRGKDVVPTTVLHPPSRAWNFRGFWGYAAGKSEGAGFSQLGVLWGKTADRGAPKEPDLFEDTALAGANTALRNHLTTAGSLGRYHRVSRCAGDPKSTATNTFSMNIQDWLARGLYPMSAEVSYADDALKRLVVVYQKNQTKAIPFTSQAPLASPKFFIWHAEQISEITIRLSKPDNAPARVTQIEFLRDTKDAWNNLNPTILGNPPAKPFQEVKVSRPAPYEKHRWFFSGF